MKKLIVLAGAALMLSACSSEPSGLHTAEGMAAALIANGSTSADCTNWASDNGLTYWLCRTQFFKGDGAGGRPEVAGVHVYEVSEDGISFRNVDGAFPNAGTHS